MRLAAYSFYSDLGDFDIEQVARHPLVNIALLTVVKCYDLALTVPTMKAERQASRVAATRGSPQKQR